MTPPRSEDETWARVINGHVGIDRCMLSCPQCQRTVAHLRAYAAEQVAQARAEMEHPWASFLEARMRCIAWMANEGKHDEEIAGALSMIDVQQITLIRMTAEERAAIRRRGE